MVLPPLFTVVLENVVFPSSSVTVHGASL